MDQFFDRIEGFFIARTTDGKGLALTSSATGAANAVDVVFGMAGDVEIEHVADRRHIKAARGHIRRHKDTQLAVAEGIERACALALVEVAVDWCGIKPVFLERLGADVDIRLAVAEDDRVGACVPFFGDQLAQNTALFAAFAVAARGFEHHHALFDGFGGGRLTSDLDARRRRQEGVGDALDLGRHGGREEKGLAGERGEREDAFDIRNKAHVEHPVGFVDDHDLHAGQQQLATFEMVKKATRGRDKNVNALVDQLVLFLE